MSTRNELAEKIFVAMCSNHHMLSNVPLQKEYWVFDLVRASFVLAEAHKAEQEKSYD
jgi:hypothetical protein